MKPTSKKEQYTVICENSNQTCDVLNYIDKDHDRTWWHWEYVTRIDTEDSDINESNEYDFPIISFEEWQSLPDEHNYVYSNSQFNSETFETKCGHVYTENKKLIGYKLIKEEYKEAFSKLMDIDIDYVYSTDDEPFHFSVDCNVEDKMIKLNLIDVWCEKIYDESITLKSGKVLTAYEIEEVKEILKNK